MPDCGVHYLWFAFVCFLIRSHPPLDPPPPLPLFEADSQNFAKVPGGLSLKIAGLPSAGTIGGPKEEEGCPSQPPAPPF